MGAAQNVPGFFPCRQTSPPKRDFDYHAIFMA